MRPSFATIISKLQTLAESDFVEIPISMFSDMQENWKVEVKSIIEDLRVKEEVSCLRETYIALLVRINFIFLIFSYVRGQSLL